MPTCPEGHDSDAAEHRDRCGAPTGDVSTPATAEPASEPGAVSGPVDVPASEDAPAPESVPEPADTDSTVELPTVAGGPTGWRVAVTADHDYHQRVLAMGGPDADAMTFPQLCPERQFPLVDRQMLIGRHSRSRDIDPQIDLAGPPEDPGVSHSHALLVPGEDGTWSLVDLDSSNGTYLNGSVDPLAPNTPVVLHDGDRIHVGAWTTLTVSADGHPAE